MKRKILCLFIWLIITCGYFFLMADTGRAIGSHVNSAIEKYDSDKIIYAVLYNDLDYQFKYDFIGMGIINIFEIVVSVGCYHFAFKKSKKE